ncbi:MAG: peptidase family protein, partial [Chloroflexi bacterium]|nr:peptidase family protein [Chloroflexota bacterium]
MSKYRIESMLSARLFLHPQVAGDKIYFISNLSGRLSLYAMVLGGGVPAPLIPPDIAMPNPDFIGQNAFRVLPKLGKIMLMLDKDGDENYQPMLIPLDGGIPEPLFGERFAGQQVHCTECDPDANLALFTVDPRTNPVWRAYRTNLASLETVELGESLYGNFPGPHKDDMHTVVLFDGYTAGDVVLYLWREGRGERKLLFGKPIEQRSAGEQVPMNGIESACLTERGLFFTTSLFDDHFSLGYFALETPEQVHPVRIEGLVHSGVGEMTELEHRQEDVYTLAYNIDGCSWVYEGSFDENALRFKVNRVLVGQVELSNGMLESISYEKASRRYALSFSTATSPAQIYVIEPDGNLVCKTDERILGIPPGLLSPGEDYAYTSHDGLRISARLYLPAEELGYTGRRPVIFYIHGGPQSQERPDFTWFSMPIIQFLTLNGFAVWVP